MEFANKSRKQARQIVRLMLGKVEGNFWYTRYVHHFDFNPMNNDPENLVIVTKSEHAKIHNGTLQNIKHGKQPHLVGRGWDYSQDHKVYRCDFCKELLRIGILNWKNLELCITCYHTWVRETESHDHKKSKGG